MLLVKVEESLEGGTGLEVEGPWALRFISIHVQIMTLAFHFVIQDVIPQLTALASFFHLSSPVGIPPLEPKHKANSFFHMSLLVTVSYHRNK